MYMALASLVIEYYFFFVVNFKEEGPHTVSIRSQKMMIVSVVRRCSDHKKLE
jgi:hypothetical protein